MNIEEIKGGNKVTLTIKEAYEIKSLLETLEAMGGVMDEEFNKECDRAGIVAGRLERTIGRANKSVKSTKGTKKTVYVY